MAQRSAAWLSGLAVLSALALQLAGCASDQPRNGAGQPVDRQTGTVAPGASTSE